MGMVRGRRGTRDSGDKGSDIWGSSRRGRSGGHGDCGVAPVAWRGAVLRVPQWAPLISTERLRDTGVSSFGVCRCLLGLLEALASLALLLHALQ